MAAAGCRAVQKLPERAHGCTRSTHRGRGLLGLRINGLHVLHLCWVLAQQQLRHALVPLVLLVQHHLALRVRLHLRAACTHRGAG